MVDMLFGEGQYFLNIPGISDSLFNVPERKQFLSYDPSQAFSDLLLPFREDTVQGEAQYSPRLAGMEQ